MELIFVVGGVIMFFALGWMVGQIIGWIAIYGNGGSDD